MVQQQFELDPFTNTLFLFCGRRRDRIKGLYWEKDGFILLYKRLEQGAYQWPRSESEVCSLTPQQFLRHYPAYKKKQLNVSELARVCDLSRTTVYKYIDLLEG